MKLNDKIKSPENNKALRKEYPAIFLQDIDPFTFPSIRIMGIRYIIGYTAKYPASVISKIDPSVFPLVASAILENVSVVEKEIVVNPRQFNIVYGFNKQNSATLYESIRMLGGIDGSSVLFESINESFNCE